MDDLIDLTLLERYITGETSPGETARARAWIEASPERIAEVDAYRRILNEAAAITPAGFDVDALWARLDRRTADSRAKGATTQPPKRPAPFLRYAGTTAALVVTLGLGALVGHSVDLAGRSSATRAYITGAGQRETIMLPDGTHVTLAPASTLRVLRRYGRATRDVALEGEAYFSVVHDPAHPFVVRTRNASTTDLGTNFDVRAYLGDSAVRVAVVEGSVSVRGNDRSRSGAVVLRAGDLVTVPASAGLQLTHGADVTSITAWSQGHLVFTDAPLRDVLPELSRWFDIEISAPDPQLASATLTASFRDEPVGDVLATLAGALGVQYERAGRTVTLRRPNTRHR